MAKEKFYTLWGKATDSNGEDHYVTVVGRFTTEKVVDTVSTETVVLDEKDRQHDALIITDVKRKVRTFSMAKSICHSSDEFNVEEGIRLAKRRLERAEPRDLIGTITSEDITMLNEDMCNILVFNEVNHVIKNIDKYLD